MSGTAEAPFTKPGSGNAPRPGDGSAEFSLLLHCCRTILGTTAAPPDLQGIDWNSFISLAERHDLLPLAYHGLASQTGSVPQFAVQALKSGYAQNWRRNLRFVEELVRILDCLESHGIVAVPYKGPVLAQNVYPDMTLRQFSDLDILVRPADLERAMSAVRELGYTLVCARIPGQWRAYIRSGYELAFDGPAGRNLLELQWRILPRFYAVEFEVANLIARSTFTEISGRRVRTLCPEDLLLVLCAHAGKHAWARLNWLCDTALVIHRREIDYATMRAGAKKLGIERILAITLGLSRDLFGVPTPPQLQTLLNDRCATAVVAEVKHRLASSSDLDITSCAYFRLIARTRERVRDKVRFVARLAWTPAEAEWSAVTLPPFLFPLYRLVRMGRLAKRLLASAAVVRST